MVEISHKKIDGKLYLLLNSYLQKGDATGFAKQYRYNMGGHKRLARVIKLRTESVWGLWVYPNDREESK